MKKILFSVFIVCGILISSAFGAQPKQEDYGIIPDFSCPPKAGRKNPGYPAKRLKTPSGFFAAALRANFARPAKAGQAKFGIIINLAGRERMLIQKMVKETLLIYSGIDSEKNRDNLRSTVNLFIKTLEGLRDGDSSLQLPATQSELIKREIDAVALMFKEIEFIFKRVIDGEMPSRDAVIELAEKEPLLLNNMDLVVQMYEDQARNVMSGEASFLGVEINLAGKQRMLSQKMAKEALFVYLDIESRKNKRLLQQTCALFEKTLKGLKYGDGELGLPGTREKKIVHQIDRVMSIWSELKPIIERSSDIMIDKISKEELEKLGQLNVLVLDEMDKTVRMYEDLAR